mmetsp:Transcript_33080/g.63201  ORF Transcript_33080/g.63201 Transcript_33080/m.63201 type:complete len:226 (-) Transcript_33080:339-1016(-)|eukprot:CAMPEP_0201658090 /NCGR_PEP_ID=MMETSP0494-20130426/1110_1 /ASSEMBLY_ACC=CAM_ASM_000839 /TAXON_ID=420259 /ORGANISM="Thalassiosira gravida, Strain GMp14c1" /LENGTH=225 /DNA_ID=CAMNT_0048135037 /DNA_START=158 /DNA_END=835 /DNA_ORIENTATION=-
MPRFFDDYSNTYLTHDSAAGRKQQRRGWKFRENFKLHYQKNLPEWHAGPMGLASGQQSYLRNRRNPSTGQVDPNDPSVPPLPEGWKEEKDSATGAFFYTNDESGERSWVRPNFNPPGGPGGGGGGPGMMRGPPPNFRGRPPPQIMNAPPPQFQQPPPQMGGPPPSHQFNQPPPGMGIPPPQFQQPPPQMGGPPPPSRFAPPPPHMGGPPPNFPPPPGSFMRPPPS